MSKKRRWDFLGRLGFGRKASRSRGNRSDRPFGRSLQMERLEERQLLSITTPPEPGQYHYFAKEDTPLVVGSEEGVLSNSVEIYQEQSIATVQTEPQYGTLLLSNDGSFVYMPDSDYVGFDSFTYLIVPDQEEFAVTIDVRPVADSTISGVVYGDTNGNGIQDVGEAGLEDWIVELQRIGIDGEVIEGLLNNTIIEESLGSDLCFGGCVAVYDGSIEEYQGDLFIASPNSNSGVVLWYDGDTGELREVIGDPVDGGSFGKSIAINGNTLLIGDPDEDYDYQDERGVVSRAGAVYQFNIVYTEGSSEHITTDGPDQVIYTGIDPAENDQFGYSLAVWDEYFAVGAIGEDVDAEDSGAVHVFGSDGTRLQVLSDPLSYAGIGIGYTLSGEDDYLLVGAPDASISGESIGAAYLFDVSTGTLAQRFAGPDTHLSDFGRSVAMFDGNVLIGAPLDFVDGMPAGAVYEYDPDGTLLRTITNPERQQDDVGDFGRAIRVSDDDLFVSDPYFDMVYCFPNGLTDTYDEFSSPDASETVEFGYAFAPRGSGGVFVGDPGFVARGYAPGAAFLIDDTGALDIEIENPVKAINGLKNENMPAFDTTMKVDGVPVVVFGTGSSVWVFSDPQKTITPVPTQVNDEFGSYIVRVDDYHFLTAAPARNIDDVESAGVVYLYNTSGTCVRTFLNPQPETNARFGDCVDVVGDYVFVKCLPEVADPNNTGAVHVYELFPSDNDPSPTPISSFLTFKNRFGTSVAGFKDKLLVGVPEFDYGGATLDSGAVYLMSPESGWPLLTITKRPNDAAPIQGDRLGYCVAVAGENFLVSAPGRAVNDATDNPVEAAGVVYLFDADGSLLRTFENPDPHENDQFGMSLAVVDGYVLIGVPYADRDGKVDSGAAYLFELEPDDGSLNPEQIASFQRATPVTEDLFGWAVGGIDGELVISAPQAEVSGLSNAGIAFIYSPTNGNWFNPSVLTIDEIFPVEDSFFGWSIAVTESEILVTSKGNGNQGGSASLFDRTTGTYLRGFVPPGPQPEQGIVWTSTVFQDDQILVTGFADSGSRVDGDLNGDGIVGSADLDIVRGNWGAAVSPGDWASGDPSGDGVVGGADLDIVRSNWGAIWHAPSGGRAYLYDISTGDLLRTFSQPDAAACEFFGMSATVIGKDVVIAAPYATVGSEEAGIIYVYDTGIKTQSTEAYGRFRFDELETGTYRIRQFAPSTANQYSQTYPTGDLDYTVTIGEEHLELGFGNMEDMSRLWFDFGTTISPVGTGFKRVSPSDEFDEETGFGWSSPSEIDARDRDAAPSSLEKDFVFASGGPLVFEVALPNGQYNITVTSGDLDRNTSGVIMLSSGGGASKATIDINQEMAAFCTNTVQSFEIAEGLLRVILQPSGPGAVAALNGLDIVPVSGTGEALHFDFGTAISPVATGYVRVTSTDEFDSASGYGWGAPVEPDGKERGAVSDWRQRDFVSAATDPSVFAVELPDGTYDVTVTTGDNDEPTEGKIVLASGIDGSRKTLQIDHEAGEFDTDASLVTVTGGVLWVSLTPDVAGKSLALNALDIVPIPGTDSDEYHFDFGTTTSAVATGFVRIAPDDVFSEADGYGWVVGTASSENRAMAVKRDFCYSNPIGGQSEMQFEVDLPKGAYDVEVTLGNADWSVSEDGDEIPDLVAVDMILEFGGLDGDPSGTLSDTITEASLDPFVTKTYRLFVSSEGHLTLNLSGSGTVLLNSLRIMPVDVVGPQAVDADEWVWGEDAPGLTNSVTLVFNEPIDESTLADNVTITADGEVLPIQVSQLTEKQFKVSFPAKRDDVALTATVAAGVCDLDGNPLAAPVTDSRDVTSTDWRVVSVDSSQASSSSVFEGSLSRVVVTFNQGFDGDAPAASEFTIIRPDGTTIAASDISVEPVDNPALKAYAVEFPEQVLSGTYSLAFTRGELGFETRMQVSAIEPLRIDFGSEDSPVEEGYIQFTPSDIGSAGGVLSVETGETEGLLVSQEFWPQGMDAQSVDFVSLTLGANDTITFAVDIPPYWPAGDVEVEIEDALTSTYSTQTSDNNGHTVYLYGVGLPPNTYFTPTCVADGSGLQHRRLLLTFTPYPAGQASSLNLKSLRITPAASEGYCGSFLTSEFQGDIVTGNLVGDVPAGPMELLFDFATFDSPVAPAYTRVTAEDMYDGSSTGSSTRGFGWLADPNGFSPTLDQIDGLVESVSNTGFTFLNVDCLCVDSSTGISEMEITVALPDGNYSVFPVLQAGNPEDLAVTLQGSSVITATTYEFVVDSTDGSAFNDLLTLNLSSVSSTIPITSLEISFIPPADQTGPRVVAVHPTGTTAGQIDQISVEFDEPVDASTLTLSDGVRIDGSSISLDSNSPIHVDGGKYVLVLDEPLVTEGLPSTRQLTIGTSVTDLAGNMLNQDRDGTNGESSEDVYSYTFDVPAAARWRFDFGTDTSPVSQGYEHVTAASMYNATDGYGWMSESLVDFDRVQSADDVERDFVTVAPGSDSLTFALDVPDGYYDLEVILGDYDSEATLDVAVSVEELGVDVVSPPEETVLTRSYTGIGVWDGQLTLTVTGLPRHEVDGSVTTTAPLLNGLTISRCDTDGPKVLSITESHDFIGWTDRVVVTFDEPIDESTFAAEDVHLVDPAMPLVDIGPITLRTLSETRYEILFPALRSDHEYLLTLGPDIRDVGGTRMNQHADWATGDYVSPAFTAVIGEATPPVAVDDIVYVDVNQPVELNLLGNDGAQSAVFVESIDLDTFGTRGSVTIDAEGRVLYDPDGAYASVPDDGVLIDRFRYTIRNANGDSSTATVSISGFTSPRMQVFSKAHTPIGSQVGSFVIESYTGAGAADTGFGDGGRTVVELPLTTMTARTIGTCGSGTNRKTILAGCRFENGSPYVTLVRLDADGQPDASFGDGDGVYNTTVPGIACAFAVESDESDEIIERIVVAGTDDEEGGQVFLARFKPNEEGTWGPDDAFGTNGVSNRSRPSETI